MTESYLYHAKRLVGGAREHAAPVVTLPTEALALLVNEIEALGAAIEAIEKLHKIYFICDECDCPEGTHPDDYEFIDCADYNGCENSILGIACGECCADSAGYHTEYCADSHRHTMDESDRCDTIKALRRALDG